MNKGIKTRMRTTAIITTTDEAVLLEPVKEPITGWNIRPGTFRVAQPYDKVPVATETSAQLVALGRPPKKQKLSTPESNNDDELTQWLQSALQLILENDSTKTYISSMERDYFYGTYVGAPANEEFILDLVKAQPTLQLLRHGFQSTSANRRRNQADDDASVEFDEIQLDPDDQQQQLEMTDVYETLVANKHPRPAFIHFPTEGQPRYLVPPLSAFVASDFSSIQGLKAIAKVRKVVVEKLFPAWGLELVAHWYWLKNIFRTAAHKALQRTRQYTTSQSGHQAD
ncbi:hypothetical protein KI688_008830 [Linnemannia hyalina]|uniref:Uncharacterized protein n=1 Tax=Linnemannia hyalina TaxID=64524 RepID=A0A9P7XHQ1_9FUNG|nr:hypothetical protein KI688_008830 [Linnemannia hyalina]